MSGSSPTILNFDDDDANAKVDVASLYTSDTDPAFISTPLNPSEPFDCAVRVKNSHGGINVDVESTSSSSIPAYDSYGLRSALIDLGGVSGSCNVVTKGSSSLSARVHFDSVFSSGWSSIAVESGDAEVTVNRKVHAEVRLLSSTSPLNSGHSDILDGAPLPDVSETPPPSRIDIKTDAVETTVSSKVDETLDYFEGSVFNNTVEPDSRFEVKEGNMKRSGGGKVDLDGASVSALDAFGQKEKVRLSLE